MIMPVRHISVGIQISPAHVYEFASNPENFPKWASGLSAGIEKSGEEWIADSPMGKVRVKVAPKNVFGIIDHDVTLPTGEVFHNPMRVLRNKLGSEVVFSLFRHSNMTDAEFERDAETIAKDLAALKAILEK